MDLAATLTLAVLAVAIEAFVGYPLGLFRAIGHPVTWIGRLIALEDRALNQEKCSFAARRAKGIMALILLLIVTAAAANLLSAGLAALALPQPLNLALTALIASSLIAQRSLDRHVRAVADALDLGLDEGRNAAACIVGRDVNGLDAAGTARAAIESLAESFCDGVVAPAFWLALGGLPGGMCYKAINTADSIIGHRTPRYAAFGFASAKLDDAVNFCPARLAALCIVIAAFLVRGASVKGSWRIMRRDARGHPSPNAGWPEAALAGALGLRLGGPRVYGDAKVDDAWIGSGGEASANDIRQALALYRRACGIHWLALAVTAFAISQA
ncbi:MAG: adenosylcobinamide-phosphate synthase CbiB [Beijerinckiaceae bacterium]|nr:adenosylcobinamide-phosphate synthase CbiB [Beijerinckiaceae bacterium]